MIRAATARDWRNCLIFSRATVCLRPDDLLTVFVENPVFENPSLSETVWPCSVTSPTIAVVRLNPNLCGAVLVRRSADLKYVSHSFQSPFPSVIMNLICCQLWFCVTRSKMAAGICVLFQGTHGASEISCLYLPLTDERRGVGQGLIDASWNLMFRLKGRMCVTKRLCNWCFCGSFCCSPV